MINNAGVAWLSGPKYDYSARIHGASWTIGVEQAVGYFGLRQQLDAARDIHDVIRVFRGRFFWKQDDVYQLYDVVKPPDHLLLGGGDDCDGWAMTHTQAINYALGRFGWVAWSVSYLADPFWLSHHYTVARDPQGRYWVVQPQPTETDWRTHGERNQTVFGPYATLEETPAVVAGWYGAKVVWWDKRDGLYRPV
jgi:hypothetical protein